MPFNVRLPTALCQAATGRGRRRLPVSGTESRSSVTSSPEGIRRSTGSAEIVPAKTTTFTVTMFDPSFPGATLPPATDTLGLVRDSSDAAGHVRGRARYHRHRHVLRRPRALHSRLPAERLRAAHRRNGAG